MRHAKNTDVHTYRHTGNSPHTHTHTDWSRCEGDRPPDITRLLWKSLIAAQHGAACVKSAAHCVEPKAHMRRFSVMRPWLVIVRLIRPQRMRSRRRERTENIRAANILSGCLNLISEGSPSSFLAPFHIQLHTWENHSRSKASCWPVGSWTYCFLSFI